MHILIGSSKTMSGGVIPRLFTGCTEPEFQRQADSLALHLARYSADELAGMLHCSEAIARETLARYRRFHDPGTRRPAIFTYDGLVYKHIRPADLTDEQLRAANSRLTIASYIYGLLRPLDRINPYRLEGDVELPVKGFTTVARYWQPIITDALIERVKADGGVLVNLASAEFKRMFDWKRVEREVRVETPEFTGDDGRRLPTANLKVRRGEMVRQLLLAH